MRTTTSSSRHFFVLFTTTRLLRSSHFETQPAHSCYRHRTYERTGDRGALRREAPVYNLRSYRLPSTRPHRLYLKAGSLLSEPHRMLYEDYPLSYSVSAD
ncbi:unnamed protein product [Ectocarpus sp. 12 AP-2014]